jgi:hypothetical protein
MHHILGLFLLLPALALAQPAGKPGAPPVAAGKGEAVAPAPAPNPATPNPATPAPAPPAQASAPQPCPSDMTASAGSGEQVTCICPASGTAASPVWGSGPYTADSAVCTAALHAGATTRRGGTVTLRVLPGQSERVNANETAGLRD